MIETILATVLDKSPVLGLIGLIIGVFIPKILEFKFKSKRAIISEREESIKRLTRELNEAYEREEKLEKELDLWKEKYFAQR